MVTPISCIRVARLISMIDQLGFYIITDAARKLLTSIDIALYYVSPEEFHAAIMLSTSNHRSSGKLHGKRLIVRLPCRFSVALVHALRSVRPALDRPRSCSKHMQLYKQ